MKIQVKTHRMTTLATVKNGKTFFYKGEYYHKFRSKAGITKAGKVIELPDATMVQVKIG